MGCSKSTIKYHLKHYKHIKRYHPMQEHKRYLENRKNCKKKTTLTFKQLLWLDEKFNKFHYTPKQICKLYEIEFNDKFPMCFKTLYKYIYLGLFGLNKRNLYFHSKKKIHKGKKYKRGNLSNDFKTIKKAKHEKGTFGWFQMNTIVGKDKKSACLTLTEELTKFTFF